MFILRALCAKILLQIFVRTIAIFTVYTLTIFDVKMEK